MTINDDDDDTGYDELMAAYNIEGVIGSGGYGTVYSATRRSDGLTVSIRTFSAKSHTITTALWPWATPVTK